MWQHAFEYVSVAGGWYASWAHHAAHGRFRGTGGVLGAIVPILRVRFMI